MPAPPPDVATTLAAVFTTSRPGAVSSAYLFGGYAEGRAHRESDVDVGVLLDRTICPTDRDRFEEGLRIAAWLAAELRFPHIDLVVLNDAPPPLGARIAAEGTRVYCADSESDHAFRRDSQLRAADLAPYLRRARAIKLQSIAR